MRNYEAKLVDSSRLIADHLFKDIGKDSERFYEMLMLALRDEYPLSMRAARVISLVVEKHPLLVNDYIDLIIHKLPALKIEGVRRGLLKIFSENPPEMNEDQIGHLTDLAFTWLADYKQAIAIRYYSIEILLFVCSKYPELKNELSAILEGLVHESSAGIRSKAIFVLKEFKKQNKNS